MNQEEKDKINTILEESYTTRELVRCFIISIFFLGLAGGSFVTLEAINAIDMSECEYYKCYYQCEDNCDILCDCEVNSLALFLKGASIIVLLGITIISLMLAIVTLFITVDMAFKGTAR